MIVGTSIRPIILPPIKADGLFPEVCRDEGFSYTDPDNTGTQLKALQDAEAAFSLYKSCNYQLPNNFDRGIEKITLVVGEEVTAWNATRLRKKLERQISGLPAAGRPIVQRLRDRVSGLFL